MFCQQCGLKLPEGAKFCSVCGTPAVQRESNNAYQNNAGYSNNKVAQWQSAFEQAKTTEQIEKKKKPQKKALLIVLVCVAVFVLLSTVLGIVFSNTITSSEARNAIRKAASEAYYGTSITNIEKICGSSFQGNISVDYSCSFYKYSGTLIIRATKTGDSWDTTIVEDNVSFSLEPNDNYYCISTEFGGNRSMIVRFKEISGSSITLEYCSHDLGMYGNDQYDAGQEECSLAFNSKTKKFEFEFAGYWRISESYIEYNRYEINQYFGEEFTRLDPIDPSEYWWFDDAQRQTGYYGENEAVAFNTAKVGDTITFGHYEMDNNESNGADSIVWRVIDQDDDKILVISEYCLYCQDAYSGDYLTWEYSPTRSFLNGDFYDQVFSADEKEKILKTNVINDNNEEYGTNGGNNTSDYLFLLSISEVNSYFPSKEDRLAYGTLSTQKQVDQGAEAFDWWLRSPGSISEGFDSRLQQSYVGSNGFVYEGGTLGECYNLGIRPAMWIKTK